MASKPACAKLLGPFGKISHSLDGFQQLLAVCIPSLKPAQFCPLLNLCAPPAPDNDLIGGPVDDDRVLLTAFDIDNMLREVQRGTNRGRQLLNVTTNFANRGDVSVSTVLRGLIDGYVVGCCARNEERESGCRSRYVGGG